MKCPKCGIEMQRKKKTDTGSVWVCRNPKCTEKGREQTNGTKQS